MKFMLDSNNEVLEVMSLVLWVAVQHHHGLFIVPLQDSWFIQELALGTHVVFVIC